MRLQRSDRLSQLLIVMFLAALALVAAAQPATGQTVDMSDQETAQEDQAPYSAVLTDVEPPGWLQALGPLSELPVWASAAVISALIAGAAFILPTVVRWVWSLQTTRDSET